MKGEIAAGIKGVQEGFKQNGEEIRDEIQEKGNEKFTYIGTKI